MNESQFIEQIVYISRKKGFKIETNRNGQTQIDFGNKKLHSGHLAKLYPAIMKPGVNFAVLIESVAPGRPCTHKPMREIVGQIAEFV